MSNGRFWRNYLWWGGGYVYSAFLIGAKPGWPVTIACTVFWAILLNAIDTDRNILGDRGASVAEYTSTEGRNG